MNRPTSLTAKLLALAPGETIIFFDRRAKGKATNMERQAYNLFSKNPTLRTRQFTTKRYLLVNAESLSTEPVLAVTRI